MSLASKTYFKFAQKAEKLMDQEKDEKNKKEYRKVAQERSLTLPNFRS